MTYEVGGYKIDNQADGMHGRVSITDEDGHEVLRLRNVSEDLMTFIGVLGNLLSGDADE